MAQFLHIIPNLLRDVIDKLEIRRTKAAPSAGVNWDSILFFYDLETQTMNRDVFEGKWKQIRGVAKSWWDKPSDDQPMLNNSQREQFVGILQKRYGYTKEKATSELNEHYSKIKLN